MGGGDGSRSQRSDGAMTRARILDVALPLFAERGYAGTSIRAIATDAGCNVATLFYHFEDKEGLYATVVQRLHEDLLDGIPAVSGVAVDAPQDLVGFYVERRWEFALAHRVHMRLAVRHILDKGAHPGVVMDHWSERLMERADALVLLFRPTWSMAERRLLVTSMQHLFVRFAIEDREQLSRLLGEPDDLDQAIRDWFEGLLRRELGIA